MKSINTMIHLYRCKKKVFYLLVSSGMASGTVGLSHHPNVQTSILLLIVERGGKNHPLSPTPAGEEN